MCLSRLLTRSGCAGGLVQVEQFSVLPDVGPGAAAAGVLASMAPLLASVWKRPDPARFARCVALASLNRCNLACLSPYHLHQVLHSCGVDPMHDVTLTVAASYHMSIGIYICGLKKVRLPCMVKMFA